LKRQYDMGLRLQVKIKFQTETLPDFSLLYYLLKYIVCDYSPALANNGVSNNRNEFTGKQRPVFTP
jgi:hypothetical protein